MRRYNEPVEVLTDKCHTPLRIRWRKQEFQVVRIKESWRWAGKWWFSGLPQRRFYYRIEVQPVSRYKSLYVSSTFEIYRCGKSWTLWCVGD